MIQKGYRTFFVTMEYNRAREKNSYFLPPLSNGGVMCEGLFVTSAAIRFSLFSFCSELEQVRQQVEDLQVSISEVQ